MRAIKNNSPILGRNSPDYALNSPVKQLIWPNLISGGFYMHKKTTEYSVVSLLRSDVLLSQGETP
ncbi:MAG: hypothetical protein M3Z62_17640, partial [Metasolibacillus sp.]